MLSLSDACKIRKSYVGCNLRTMRRDIGHKQQVVADAIGVNVVTLSGYETGKSEPSLEVLCRLADYYDCSIDFLVR